MVDFDYHIHSNLSSCATQTFKQIVSRAKEAGIRYLSLTDHDCIDGLADCRQLCESSGITFVNGVELSTSSDTNTPLLPNNTGLHILGYRFEADNDIFKAGIKEKKERSLIRNSELSEYLIHNGYSILHNGNVDEQIIKQQLLDKHYFLDKKQVKSFLNSPDLLQLFSKERMSIQSAIKLIHSMGGIAIWAHPYNGENRFQLNDKQLNETFEYLVRLGIDGVEAFHYSNLPIDNINYLLQLAQKTGIGVTLGSDRHFWDNKYGNDYFSMEKAIEKIKFDFNSIKKFVNGGKVN